MNCADNGRGQGKKGNFSNATRPKRAHRVRFVDKYTFYVGWGVQNGRDKVGAESIGLDVAPSGDEIFGERPTLGLRNSPCFTFYVVRSCCYARQL